MSKQKEYVFEIDCTIEQTSTVGIFANDEDEALEKLHNQQWDKAVVNYSKLIIENIDKEKVIDIDEKI